MKQTLFFGLSILGITLAILATQHLFLVKRHIPMTPVEETPLFTTAELEDSDQDSLKDWEEELWKTDSTKKDTDGDGVGDAEEVKQGRNPAITGKGQTEPVTTLPRQIQEKTSVEPSKPEPSVTPSFTLPAKASIQAQAEVDPATFTLKAYGNALARVFIDSMHALEQDPAIFLSVIADNPPATAFNDLQKVGERYTQTANAFAAITAPAELQSLHQDVVQNHRNQGQATKILATYQGSKIPQEAYATYNKATISATEAIIGVAAFFRDRNILFTETEEGFLFNFLAR